MRAQSSSSTGNSSRILASKELRTSLEHVLSDRESSLCNYQDLKSSKEFYKEFLQHFFPIDTVHLVRKLLFSKLVFSCEMQLGVSRGQVKALGWTWLSWWGTACPPPPLLLHLLRCASSSAEPSSAWEIQGSFRAAVCADKLPAQVLESPDQCSNYF